MDNLYAFQAVAISSILFQSVCYVVLSVRLRSWFHFASLHLLVNIVANGVLPLLGMAQGNLGGSFYAYSFCQCTYSAIALVITCAVFLIPPKLPVLRFLGRSTVYSPAIPWIFLVGSFLLFAPILIEFRSELSDPRLIYEQTRTGFGPIYFLSTMLSLVAWSTYLFVRRGVISTTIFFTICAGLTYLHGSKGQILSLVTVYFIYRVYALRKGVSLWQFIPMAAGGAFVLGASIILFAFNTVDTTNLLEWTENYSNSTSNAMAIIDNPALFGTPRWGRITLESEIYSRIPRFLYPGKRKDYGVFELSRIYYPDAFASEAGAPTFGIGALYDDAGIFSLPLFFFWNLVMTWLTLGVVRQFQLSPTPGMFILLAFLSGIEYIPLGVGYLLPESIVLAFLINLTFKYWPTLRRSLMGRPLRTPQVAYALRPKRQPAFLPAATTAVQRRHTSPPPADR